MRPALIVQGRLALGQYVHTHLARTRDGGANWTFVKVLNRSSDGTLTMTDGTPLSGTWRYEVSSIVSDPADPDRIILLASDDHGATWRFVRTLLDPEDASRFGYDLFDGSSLARENGRFFLLVVPGNKNVMHDGTAVFEFESLAAGRLRRDADGQPVLAAYFAPQPGIFSGPGAGQACYDEHNSRGGLIMPQFNVKAYPEVFQIFQTGRRIITKEDPTLPRTQ